MLKPDNDDRGSVIIAMTIVMILALLSAAILSRSITTMKAGRTDQDFNGALGGADGSVADALFQLDQKVAPITGGACGAGVTCFKNTGTTGEGATSWSYTATRTATDPNTYTVRGHGVVNSKGHDVVATLSRTVLFDYGLFATNAIQFSGASCSPGELGIPIGASGSISSPCGSINDCYLPSTSSCPPAPGGKQVNKRHDVPAPGTSGGPPVPTTGLASPACPLTGGVWNVPAAPPPGTYVCSSGTINFATDEAAVSGGRFILYVTGTATINIDRQVVLNGGVGPSCTAVNFQVYSAVSDSWTWNGKGPNICGAIYAPNTAIRADGDKLSLQGAITAKSFDFNGKPKGQFVDPSLLEIVKSDWTMTNYHEVGTGCTSNC